MKIDKIHIQFSEGNKSYNLSLDWQESIESSFFTIETIYVANRVSVHINPKKTIILKKLELVTQRGFVEGEKYFVNGYQTWTDSKEYGLGEQIKGLNLALNPVNKRFRFKYYGDYFFWKYSNKKNDFHSYSFTYFRKPNPDKYGNEEIEFFASRAENTGFTIFNLKADKNEFLIIKDCQNLMLNENYLAFDILHKKSNALNAFSECWDEYAGLIDRNKSLTNKKQKTISGWTSWYNYYTDITPKIILENLAAFASRSIPIDVFQIDDGYQMAVGDWLPNAKFDGQMNGIANQIHKAGYKAGLWIAPFICEENSMLRAEHPEWILRDYKNNEIVAGYSPLWSGKFYALDFENQEVKNYIQKVFKRALNEWGFDMLKLDFLYSVCLFPLPHKTKGQVMDEAMRFLRNIAGDKLLLGCGVPLASAFNQVDYCRVGADVALKWEDKLLKNVIRYRERVSTLASLHSTISRHSLNGRFFGNDPDVFILRKEKNALTADQKYTLFILNQLFGNLLFTSDNIANYDKATLDLYLKQFPNVSPQIIHVDDRNDLYLIRFKVKENELLLCANLSSKAIEIDLPKGVYFSANENANENNDGQQFLKWKITLKPFETKCLKKLENKRIELLGSDGHLFTTADIDWFVVKDNGILIERNEHAISKSNIYIRVNDLDAIYLVNGQPMKAENRHGIGVITYSFPSLKEIEKIEKVKDEVQNLSIEFDEDLHINQEQDKDRNRDQKGDQNQEKDDTFTLSWE